MIRIRDAQKHGDPEDPDPVANPDPQFWFKEFWKPGHLRRLDTRNQLVFKVWTFLVHCLKSSSQSWTFL
jgi:hypothetical protein